MNRGFAALVLALPLTTGCVTVAEFRKVQRDVIDLKRGQTGGGAAAPNARLAELAARLDALEQQQEDLRGRLEVAEHRADDALREARAARQAGATAGIADSDTAARGEGPEAESEGAAAANPAASEELAAYKAARAYWSSNDWEACVDRLGEFLQTHPSSVYADDAAYWRADCYFQQGNYKKAILRFDDVVTRYPNGNKAADALYREGESLLRLGPAYAPAARKAFERILSEYPDSDRATEAKQQLELL